MKSVWFTGRSTQYYKKTLPDSIPRKGNFVEKHVKESKIVVYIIV